MQRATRLGAPLGRTTMGQQGEPPAPPSSVVKNYSGKVSYTSNVRVTPPKYEAHLESTRHTSKLAKSTSVAHLGPYGSGRAREREG